MYSLVSNSLSLGTISSGLVVGQTAYMAESGKSQIQFADFISSVPGTVFHSTEVGGIPGARGAHCLTGSRNRRQVMTNPRGTGQDLLWLEVGCFTSKSGIEQ